MSLVFSDTTNRSGIIQLIEKNLKLNNGEISGNPDTFKEFTADINLALDNALSIIFKADGRWQFDDSNHESFPVVTTNLEASKRVYVLPEDVFLKIHRVFVRLPGDNANYVEVLPVDVQTERGGTLGFWDGSDVAAIPLYYDKTGNGIFLDPIPSYNQDDGIKIYIAREGTYFTTSDTDKKPGFASLYHEYLVYNPCYKYAIRHGLKTINTFRDAMARLEEDIKSHYGSRENDVRAKITPRYIEFR